MIHLAVAAEELKRRRLNELRPFEFFDTDCDVAAGVGSGSVHAFEAGGSTV